MLDQEEHIEKRGTLGKIAHALGLAAGAILMLMMFHIVADVLLKYLFNYPLPGTMEIVASYYMVAIVMLPLMAVTLTASHIHVEFFTNHLSRKRLRRLVCIVQSLSFLALLAVFYAAVDQAMRKTASGEAWETADGTIDIWYSRWIVPIGLGFCAIAFGRVAWRTLFANRAEDQGGHDRV